MPFSLSIPSALRQTRARFLLAFVIVVLFCVIYWTLPPRWQWGRRPPPPWLDMAKFTRVANMTQMIEDYSPRTYTMFIQHIPQLLHAPGPATYHCSDSSTFGPLLFIGVFTTAAERRQRAVIRALQTLPPDGGGNDLVMRFILGRSRNETMQREAEAEAALEGDMVFLDMEENMNEGKTYTYFKWVADSMAEGQRPRFVMKADSDTFLVLPDVLHTFASLSCSDLVYWGTSWGSCSHCFPIYMRGMAYGLSWPLVSWLAHPTSPLPYSNIDGMEDARTGSWLLSLPPHPSPPLKVVDMHVHMGDWDGLTIPTDINTVALHAMKKPGHWVEIASHILQIWHDAGREWAYRPADPHL